MFFQYGRVIPQKSASTNSFLSNGIRTLLCLTLASGIQALGCGGNNNPTSEPTPANNEISISVSPKVATLAADGLLQFSAVVSGTTQTGVTWSSSDGTIAANGVFTAPAMNSPTEVTVTATSVANSGKTASAVVTVAARSSSTSVCGPPTYPCSRTDTDVIAPATPPQLGHNPEYYGGHSGAGMVAVDPAYGNRILRVTDGNTTYAGMSFMTPSDAETNSISYDETLFFVSNEGNAPCLFQFNQAKFAAQFKKCYYNVGTGNAQFGYTPADNGAFYNFYYAKLYRFLISTSTWAITPDPSFNHGLGYFEPDGPQCLDGQLAALGQWYVHDTALSSDDSTYIASLGIEQDKDAFIVVFNASKGCRWMNVKTWEVSQGWNTGLTNPVKIQWASGKTPTLPGGVHNVSLDRSGTYGVLTINGTSLPNKVFWTIDSDQVDDTCLKCVSHWACDYGVCFWDYQHETTYDMRSLTIGQADAVPDMDTTPALGNWDDDEHVSHANASPGVKNIYLVAWQPNSGNDQVSGVWSDEITGVSWDGSKRTIRFNKNWSSGYGGFEGSVRCPISRQGNYAICSSDYEMYNLDKGFGNGLNQDTCDHKLLSAVRGTNGCRTDVLLFELR